MRTLVAMAFLVLSAQAFAETTYEISPIDEKYHSDTSDCAAPNDCVYRGAQVGISNPSSSTAVPQIIKIVDGSSIIQGAGDITELYGVYSDVTLSTGGTCSLMHGVWSKYQLENGTDLSSIYHFRGVSSVGPDSNVGAEIFLNFLPNEAGGTIGTLITLLSTHADASIRHAGPAVFGSSSAPTAGYVLDAEGDQRVANDLDVLGAVSVGTTLDCSACVGTNDIDGSLTKNNLAADSVEDSELAANSVGLSELKNVDYGDFTCDDTSCEVDFPAGSTGPVTKVKTSDESTNTDTTLSNDSQLVSFSLDGSSTYAISGDIQVVSSATPDFKFTFTASAGSPTCRFAYVAATQSNNIADAGNGTACGTGVTVAFASTSVHYIRLTGYITTTTAATVNFQWAQGTSSGTNTTMKDGSTIIFTKQ